MASVIVGNCIVGIETNGLLTSCQCLFISLEIIESNAFITVGTGIVGIETNGLLISCQCLFVLLEIIEGIAFFKPLLLFFWRCLWCGGHEKSIRRGLLAFVS